MADRRNWNMSSVSMFMKIFALSQRWVIKMHLEAWQCLSACHSSETGEGIFVKPSTEEFYWSTKITKCVMLYSLYPIFTNLTVLEVTEQTCYVFYTVRTAELILSWFSLFRRTCFAEYRKSTFSVLKLWHNDCTGTVKLERLSCIYIS
jgi:hypothetical protein